MQFKREVAIAGERGEAGKVKVYKTTIFYLLVAAVCLLSIWIADNRSWIDLGVRGGPVGRQLLGAVAAAIVVAILVLPLRGISQNPERASEVPGLGEGVGLLMPKTRLESHCSCLYR